MGMRLPDVIDLAAVSPLAAELAGLRGAALTVDAAGVERIGGLGVQLLLAAQKQWRTDGHDFVVVNPSERFSECVKQMAAKDSLLQEGQG
jgi:chemotaxis protein CheX